MQNTFHQAVPTERLSEQNNPHASYVNLIDNRNISPIIDDDYKCHLQFSSQNLRY